MIVSGQVDDVTGVVSLPADVVAFDRASALLNRQALVTDDVGVNARQGEGVDLGAVSASW